MKKKYLLTVLLSCIEIQVIGWLSYIIHMAEQELYLFAVYNTQYDGTQILTEAFGLL